MHQRILSCIVFILVAKSFLANVRAFLDFEPEIIHQSFKNSGVITTHPDESWESHEYEYSICQRMYPGATHIRDARSKMGQISWDVSTPFGSVDGHIVYCDAETDDYGRQIGHFAIGPDESIYELQQEGHGSFSPIYDDYYY